MEQSLQDRLCQKQSGRGPCPSQADLAIETLRQEWVELHPTLVVCVMEGYEERLIYDALGVTQNDNDGFEEVALPRASARIATAVNPYYLRGSASHSEGHVTNVHGLLSELHYPEAILIKRESASLGCNGFTRAVPRRAARTWLQQYDEGAADERIVC